MFNFVWTDIKFVSYMRWGMYVLFYMRWGMYVVFYMRWGMYVLIYVRWGMYVGFYNTPVFYTNKTDSDNRTNKQTQISITHPSLYMLLQIVIVLVFNATFSNISAISWRPVLVVEEAGAPKENHRPWTSNW